MPASYYKEIAISAAVLLLGGCAHRDSVDRWYTAATSPSRVEPQTPEERAALERMPTIGDDASVLSLSGATVTIEPTYASAAQRTCRAFVVQREPAEGTPARRVACRDGDQWFLVPDLLEDGSSLGPEDSL